jgi:hypothetical protein
MKTNLFPLLVAALLSGAHAGAQSVECTNSEGTLHFYEWHYQGGAFPKPGMMVTARTGVSYKGGVLAQSETKGGPLPALSDLTLGWIEGSKVVVDKSEAGKKPFGRLIYAQKLTLSRPSGKPVLPDSGQLSVTATLLCTSSYATVPLP